MRQAAVVVVTIHHGIAIARALRFPRSLFSYAVVPATAARALVCSASAASKATATPTAASALFSRLSSTVLLRDVAIVKKCKIALKVENIAVEKIGYVFKYKKLESNTQ